MGTYSLMKPVLQHFTTNDCQSSLDIVKHRFCNWLTIATKKEASSSLGKKENSLSLCATYLQLYGPWTVRKVK